MHWVLLRQAAPERRCGRQYQGTRESSIPSGLNPFNNFVPGFG